MRIIVVTGTGTGVGKTVTTAALTACALGSGQSVAVVKPVQTGVRAGEPGDLAEVQRLTGHADLHEYARFAEPLAPATAARRIGRCGPRVNALADRIDELQDRELVIVEGAGGALVRFNAAGETLVHLISRLAERHQIDVVLVTSAGLGTLNSAALTTAALSRSSVSIDAVVIGEWPDQPGLAERCNLNDLADYADAPIRGVIRGGAGALERAAFGELAVRSLTAELGGTFDASTFITEHSAAPPQKESPA
ncbi:MAG: dethiobiotin synthetase [Pseudonocardiales bacterium]|jgi:dethiobiotin synthetase|nr:dethiobiotin synthetase [Pseudonocardiales bacterium]